METSLDHADGYHITEIEIINRLETIIMKIYCGDLKTSWDRAHDYIIHYYKTLQMTHTEAKNQQLIHRLNEIQTNSSKYHQSPTRQELATLNLAVISLLELFKIEQTNNCLQYDHLEALNEMLKTLPHVRTHVYLNSL